MQLHIPVKAAVHKYPELQIVMQTVSCLELDLNEAALSISLVKFAAWPQEGWVLAVGTVQSLTFYPRELKDGFIRLYRCAPALSLHHAAQLASRAWGLPCGHYSTTCAGHAACGKL